MFQAIPPRATVLLVEDSAHDSLVMRTVLEANRGARRLYVAETLADARAYLKREGVHAKAPRPNLILLDMHLPDGLGLDLLGEIKNDDALRPIPVIIVSGVATEEQQQHVYDRYAAAYVQKPDDLEDFEAVMERIEAFYLKMARLPGS